MNSVQELKKIITIAILVFLHWGCTSKEPSPDCTNAGKFVMTLKNEVGLIKLDSASKKYTILFSPDGRLEYSATAVPCNLKPDFQYEFLVRFDADFFELKNDSSLFPSNSFSIYIKKIEFL